VDAARHTLLLAPCLGGSRSCCDGGGERQPGARRRRPVQQPLELQQHPFIKTHFTLLKTRPIPGSPAIAVLGPWIMSQSEDGPSSLLELKSLRPESPSNPPFCEDETLAPSSSNEDSMAVSCVLVDNFVAPAPDSIEGAVQSVDVSPVVAVAVASTCDTAAALDAEDTEPDNASAVVVPPAPASEPVSQLSDEFEAQRLQLLVEVRERAAMNEAALEQEREHQHSITLLARQQRKSGDSDAIKSDSNINVGSDTENDSAIADFSPPLLSPVNHQCLSAHVETTSQEEGRIGSAAICDATEGFDHSLRRSQSSSPELISNQHHLPDIRVDIPAAVVTSESERGRGEGLSGHWQLRRQGVDSVLYAQLAEMGFDSRIAIVALERTGALSLQDAIDFCLDHGNEDYSGAFRSDAGDSDSTADISVIYVVNTLNCSHETAVA
jgi:hypothetical protein